MEDIARITVQTISGTIHARNRTDGKDAEFTFTLPIKEEKTVEK